jgi:hypothetical protein
MNHVSLIVALLALIVQVACTRAEANQVGDFDVEHVLFDLNGNGNSNETIKGFDGLDYGDVDGDGDLDSVHNREVQGELVIVTNAFNGPDRQYITVATGLNVPEGVVFAEYDDTLAVATALQGQVGSGGRRVNIYFQNPDIHSWVGGAIDATINNQSYNQIEADDLDGNGVTDLVALENGSVKIFHVTGDPRADNDGNGTLDEWGVVTIGTGYDMMGAEIIDIDSDGDLDIMAASRMNSGAPVWVIRNNGRHSYRAFRIGQVMKGRFPDVADFDLDGDLDVLAPERDVTQGYDLRLFLNPGNPWQSNWPSRDITIRPNVTSFQSAPKALMQVDDAGVVLMTTTVEEGDVFQLNYDPLNVALPWQATQLTDVDCKFDDWEKAGNFFGTTVEANCPDGSSGDVGHYTFEYLGGGATPTPVPTNTPTPVPTNTPEPRPTRSPTPSPVPTPNPWIDEPICNVEGTAVIGGV